MHRYNTTNVLDKFMNKEFQFEFCYHNYSTKKHRCKTQDYIISDAMQFKKNYYLAQNKKISKSL